PETDTVVGELLALLTKDIEPDALPAVVGANLIEAVVVPPTGTVFGRGLGTLDAGLVEFGAGIVAVAFSRFLRGDVFLELLPNATCPKDKLVGDTLNIGFETGVAEPVRATGEI